MTTPGLDHEKPTIALIGLRGCGKSVVGSELADLLGGECVDTDEFIVDQAGKSIAAIFAEEGEAGFRSREREAIRLAAANAPSVIAVGGGAIVDENNVRMLRQVSTLVWLTAPAEVLWQRIASDEASKGYRPPLTDRAGPDEVKHLLDERSPLYERAADLVIDTGQSTPRAVAKAIATQLNRL